MIGNIGKTIEINTRRDDMTRVKAEVWPRLLDNKETSPVLVRP